MDVTDVIGSMGRSQKKILMAVLVRPLPLACVFMSLRLSMIQVDHWCSPRTPYGNLTSEEWKECCVPKTSEGTYSQCQYLDLETRYGNSTDRLACNSWEYDENVQHHSLIQEMDLVCHRTWIVSIIYMAFTTGSLLVFVPVGYLADRFGRKPVCYTGLALGATMSLITSFCTSVEQLIAARFFSGWAHAACISPFLCLYLESVGERHRLWTLLSFNGGWSFSIMIISGVGYFVTNWRTLFIISSFPLFMPVAFLLWKFIPESARWQLTVKKYEAAKQTVLRQTTDNGILVVDIESVMKDLKKKVQLDKEKQARIGFLDMCRTRTTLKTLIIINISFFLTVFVDQGFIITVGFLGGSLHLNLVLNGVVESTAFLVTYFLYRYTSKRRALILTKVLSGILFLLIVPTGKDTTAVRITLALCGRLMSQAAYGLLYLLTPEIFPTSLRVAGLDIGMTSGRIGSILASFTDYMARIFGGYSVMVLFGAVSLFDSLLLLWLPEVTNRNLPDSLAETRMTTSGKTDFTSHELNEVLDD